MATYAELFDLKSNNSLRNKIAVACTKKAQALLDGATPTVNQVAWSASTISNPIGQADKIINYVLASNSSASAADIANATDSAIQASVDGAVDALIAGGIVS